MAFASVWILLQAGAAVNLVCTTDPKHPATPLVREREHMQLICVHSACLLSLLLPLLPPLSQRAAATWPCRHLTPTAVAHAADVASLAAPGRGGQQQPRPRHAAAHSRQGGCHSCTCHHPSRVERQRGRGQDAAQGGDQRQRHVVGHDGPPRELDNALRRIRTDRRRAEWPSRARQATPLGRRSARPDKRARGDGAPPREWQRARARGARPH